MDIAMDIVIDFNWDRIDLSIIYYSMDMLGSCQCYLNEKYLLKNLLVYL